MKTAMNSESEPMAFFTGLYRDFAANPAGKDTGGPTAHLAMLILAWRRVRHNATCIQAVSPAGAGVDSAIP